MDDTTHAAALAASRIEHDRMFLVTLARVRCWRCEGKLDQASSSCSTCACELAGVQPPKREE